MIERLGAWRNDLAGNHALAGELIQRPLGDPEMLGEQQEWQLVQRTLALQHWSNQRRSAIQRAADSGNHLRSFSIATVWQRAGVKHHVGFTAMKCRFGIRT